MSRRLEDLMRLRAHVESEIARERRRLAGLGVDADQLVDSAGWVRDGSPGRPRRWRSESDHGTERDYQAERHAWRRHGGPPPCETCKAAHALHERERVAGKAG